MRRSLARDLKYKRTKHALTTPPRPYKTPTQTLQTLHAQPHDSPISRAIMAAWVRFLAPSLRDRVLRCSFTVTS